MTNSIIVRHPKQLTLAWAQQVIRQYTPKCQVAAVKLVSVDVGTTTRVRLHVRHNVPDQLPQRWFVKLPSLTWRARLITALPRLLPTEILFYQQFAGSIPLTHPHLLLGQSRFGIGSTLVINDITEMGARPGQTSDSLTPTQAILVIKELAKFHAHFWQQPGINPRLQWLDSKVRKLEDRLGSALAVPLMRLGLIKAGTAVPEPLHRSALHYARYRQQAMAFLTGSPKTLTHHDCHPGNLYWHQGQPGFLDWQMVRSGEGIADIAYLLATALEPHQRRQHEQEFIHIYYHKLLEQGITDLSIAALWQRYREHLCYPFEAMVVTLAIGGMMELTSNLELIRRAATAAHDHNSLNLLPL